MTEDNSRHLTFSQRNGLAPIPQPLRLGQISQKFRIDVWNVFHPVFVFADLYEDTTGLADCYIENNKEYYRKVLKKIDMEFFGKKITDPSIVPKISKRSYHKEAMEYVELYEKFIMNNRFNEIFDFIEYILRNKLFKFEISEFLEIFRTNLLAYTIADEERPRGQICRSKRASPRKRKTHQ